MKYTTLILALALSQYGIANATDDDADAFDSGQNITTESMMEDMSDDRVACVEAAISDEVEEGQQFDEFVDACMQERVAQKQKTKLNNS